MPITQIAGPSVFVNGGNSLGADMTIGTNDAYALIFETNGVERARFTPTGELIVIGPVVTINSTVVDIADRVIHVNSSTGANDPVPTLISGLAVHRGAVAGVARDHADIVWDEPNSRWNFAYNTGGDDTTLGADLAVKLSTLQASANIRQLTNNSTFSGRNAANNADVEVARVDASDRVSIAQGGADMLLGSGAVTWTGAANKSLALTASGSGTLGFTFGPGGLALSQTAATTGTPNALVLTAGAHTGLSNAEAADVNLNAARTVTFSGGGAAIATQRAIRVQAPTYAAAAAQTINRAATVEISGAPVQGANVSFSAVSVAGNGTYALNVASGASRFGGDVYIRDTATGPGVNGLTLTDSSGNGARIFQNSTSQFQIQGVGSTTLVVCVPSLAMQNSIQSFADGSYDIGTSTARFRDIYNKRSLNRDHAAFTGSELVATTGAVQTTTATTTTLWTSPSLLDNSSYWVDVWVTVRDTGGANRAMYQRQACIYRQAGGGATILTGTLAPVTVEAAGLAACDVDIDVTGNTFRVRVTSIAATLNWVATIRYQGVSGNT